ncbi:MAG: helix-turn-helix transcriptional regulator [Oscillospiraceae bacterium]|nr:helix-turn-helix transcriptional regulator [Oscillospiraceae bacterium]MCR4722210.1 helix-turn-helix transcriptional regulator [Eubacteriales bacterium]
MSISYNKMWKLLIDKNMKRKDLKEKAEVSQNVMARLSKNQAVTMETMEKICSVLQCDIGDVMEFIPDEIA